ncbi:bactofilin family protein [Shewanella gelidii]|uniref:Polymer-forming cytoskeletal protein n=1 Tax=Shewanella gelidii TaxID=1642821 RepID=A0A917JLS8_9GAMM|nr:polymer-forming cytoskeletal protein [Shewanella gelidii]MCL1097040.1 polymer-forming cytoskeletal protein [Shewanella gelidii]GGI72084.1 hypothetical protein GCM10009332_06880 [Shewanella gelidii]
MLSNSKAAMTYIGAETVMDGDMILQDSALVAGVLKGSITSSGKINIEPSGIIDGDVRCIELRVEGLLKGSVTCERLYIGSHGSVDGDVSSHHMEIAAGGQFMGRRTQGPDLKLLLSQAHDSSVLNAISEPLDTDGSDSSEQVKHSTAPASVDHDAPESKADTAPNSDRAPEQTTQAEEAEEKQQAVNPSKPSERSHKTVFTAIGVVAIGSALGVSLWSPKAPQESKPVTSISAANGNESAIPQSKALSAEVHGSEIKAVTSAPQLDALRVVDNGAPESSQMSAALNPKPDSPKVKVDLKDATASVQVLPANIEAQKEKQQPKVISPTKTSTTNVKQPTGTETKTPSSAKTKVVSESKAIAPQLTTAKPLENRANNAKVKLESTTNDKESKRIKAQLDMAAEVKSELDQSDAILSLPVVETQPKSKLKPTK